jgi:hypothetical protein
LQGAGGNLDQGIFGNESQRSRHADLSVNAPAKLRVSSPWISRKGGSRLTFPDTTSCGQAQSKPRGSRRGAPEWLHAGHARPFGQRSCSQNPAKASSVGNLFSDFW